MKSSRPPEIHLRPGESLDDFMDGRLRLIQSRDGYRFSIDAILLSDFVHIKPGDIVVDLGTGCGVIPITVLSTRPVRFVLGLEVQESLADQASRNAKLNGFENKMAVILGDLKTPPLSPNSVDVVVCNPPYRRKESGRLSPNREKAVAKHEIMVSLDSILGVAGRILRAKGRLAMIYPAARMVDVLTRMRGFGLEPKRVRIVHTDSKAEAKRVLIEASAGGRGGLKILPPLYVEPGQRP